MILMGSFSDVSKPEKLYILPGDLFFIPGIAIFKVHTYPHGTSSGGHVCFHDFPPGWLPLCFAIRRSEFTTLFSKETCLPFNLLGMLLLFQRAL